MIYSIWYYTIICYTILTQQWFLNRLKVTLSNTQQLMNSRVYLTCATCTSLNHKTSMNFRKHLPFSQRAICLRRATDRITHTVLCEARLLHTADLGTLQLLQPEFLQRQALQTQSLCPFQVLLELFLMVDHCSPLLAGILTVVWHLQRNQDSKTYNIKTCLFIVYAIIPMRHDYVTLTDTVNKRYARRQHAHVHPISKLGAVTVVCQRRILTYTTMRHKVTDDTQPHEAYNGFVARWPTAQVTPYTSGSVDRLS